MMRKCEGTTTVEFAAIGLLFFTVLFSMLELGRALFMWNTLNEVTERAARLAVVCNPGSEAAVSEVAVFGTGGGGASPIPNLNADHVSITYLAPPALPETTRFVSVTISGYEHELLIPMLDITLTVPPFTTTLPVESLGALPPAASPSCPV